MNDLQGQIRILGLPHQERRKRALVHLYKRICQTHRNDDCFSYQKIANFSSMKRRNVVNLINILVKHGLVSRVDRGWRRIRDKMIRRTNQWIVSLKQDLLRFGYKLFTSLENLLRDVGARTRNNIITRGSKRYVMPKLLYECPCCGEVKVSLKTGGEVGYCYGCNKGFNAVSYYHALDDRPF